MIKGRSKVEKKQASRELEDKYWKSCVGTKIII